MMSSNKREKKRRRNSTGGADVDVSKHLVDMNSLDDKDKFKLSVQYLGKCSEHYARALHNIQAP